MFLQLLRAMLEAEQLVEVVAVARSAKEGVAACRRTRPDILLLDLALPDGKGLDVARALAKCRPEARTIIVSGEADTFRCPPDLKKQVYSVVDKTRTFDVVRQELAGCLREIAPITGAARENIGQLSPRETEILRLIGQGMSTKEIAAAASISQNTVETHRKKIAAKLGVRAGGLVRHAALYDLVLRAAELNP